jgi:hypothetical protein
MFSKCFATIAFTLVAVMAAPPVVTAANLYGGVQIGHSGGASGQGYLQLSDFAQSLPLDVRLAPE